ncbi:MAG: phytanoyl-CoA dioxygenase family protein [Actinomycetota bacterium]|nr:phytanoyl-CoA dioxygenase family protein [Actinomycetota bacterium]
MVDQRVARGALEPPKFSEPDEEAVRFFHEEGYLLMEGVLDVERDLEPVFEEYEALLGELCRRWRERGELSSTYEDLPFPERIARVAGEKGAAYQHPMNISLTLQGLTEDSPLHLGPAVFNLITSPRLLDVLEPLVGPEISSHPLQHVRMKPPAQVVSAATDPHALLVQATDWHQDLAFLLPEADDSGIVGAWVPIVDATVENGCLMVVPGSHRDGVHEVCWTTADKKAFRLAPQRVPEEAAVPLPVNRGSVLFLNPFILHASLPNQSDGIRWSFDLRYIPTGPPTGRPGFPSFPVRSRSDPASEVSDPGHWAEMWHETRRRLVRSGEEPVLYRWAEVDARTPGGLPVCD